MLDVKKACKSTHKRYGNTTASLKVCATQIKFKGSWSGAVWPVRAVALFEHSHPDPSGVVQIPKYPTRTSSTARPTIFLIALAVAGDACDVE